MVVVRWTISRESSSSPTYTLRPGLKPDPSKSKVTGCVTVGVHSNHTLACPTGAAGWPLWSGSLDSRVAPTFEASTSTGNAPVITVASAKSSFGAEGGAARKVKVNGPHWGGGFSSRSIRIE